MSAPGTWLTRTLGIAHPVCSAGMGRVAQAGLAAAVSEAGGLGVLGGVSYPPEALRSEIRAVRELTDRPFGVNLVVNAVHDGQDRSTVLDGLQPAERARLGVLRSMFEPAVARAQVEVVLDERPALLAVTFAAPPDVVDAAHDRGIVVASLVGSVSAARKAEAAGVDLLVVQGHEAGGHTGRTTTMVLVPMIVDSVSTPVLAAGGIADGRGLAAALALGACGAWVGTRFACTHEAHGHRGYKQRMVAAAPADTVITRAYSGKTLRALDNAWTRRWAQPCAQLRPFPEQYAVAGVRAETGFVDGDADQGMMPAGQAVGLVTRLEPAADVVQSMSTQAGEVLRTGVWSR